MNRNTQTILNHVTGTLLDVHENLNNDGTPNFDFIEADIHLDVAEGKLDADLNDSDIDAVFAILNNVFTNINAAIDRVVGA